MKATYISVEGKPYQAARPEMAPARFTRIFFEIRVKPKRRSRASQQSSAHRSGMKVDDYDIQVCYCPLSAIGEAHTPRRKEVGTQEPEIPTIAILERAICAWN